ncbi:MAG: ATP-binding protein, partial [Candidatus Thermoplasmatota archaeon]
DAAQLIDCDVEEPNANIFLKAPIDHQENVAVDTPAIDGKKCDYCGKCADFCRYHALAVVPQKVLIFSELCHACGGCALVCPRDAIHWEKRIIGTIDHGTHGYVDFYQGVLNIGEAMAVPVLRALKKKINLEQHVILDAPPGTACPVIETIRGSNYGILITEPTLFGFHDLKLMVDVMRHTAIPFGVIINRDGIGNNIVEQYCQDENIPILLKIPHSDEIAYLYSKGIPFVEKIDTWRAQFKHLFQQICTEVSR